MKNNFHEGSGITSFDLDFVFLCGEASLMLIFQVFSTPSFTFSRGRKELLCLVDLDQLGMPSSVLPFFLLFRMCLPEYNKCLVCVNVNSFSWSKKFLICPATPSHSGFRSWTIREVSSWGPCKPQD